MTRMLLPFLITACLFVNASAGEKDGVKQPPMGFTSLFDGKDLKSWKNADKQPEWKVENGAIHFDGSKGAKNLVSAKDYKDFEMWVDWKITKAGDSGIYLRGKPQVQIWDSTVLEGNLKEDRNKGSGGLWNNKPGSDGKVPLLGPGDKMLDKKVGEWNTMYIKMVGVKVTVVLNGSIVVDNAVFLEGKIPDTGPIELQVHGTPLWFRNVFVREIVPDKK